MLRQYIGKCRCINHRAGVGPRADRSAPTGVGLTHRLRTRAETLTARTAATCSRGHADQVARGPRVLGAQSLAEGVGFEPSIFKCRSIDRFDNPPDATRKTSRRTGVESTDRPAPYSPWYGWTDAGHRRRRADSQRPRRDPRRPRRGLSHRSPEKCTLIVDVLFRSRPIRPDSLRLWAKCGHRSIVRLVPHGACSIAMMLGHLFDIRPGSRCFPLSRMHPQGEGCHPVASIHRSSRCASQPTSYAST